MSRIGFHLAVTTCALYFSSASAQPVQTIETTAAPAPGGHYSQAVVGGGFVFISGQLPIKPGSRNEIPVGIEAQTRQALSNVVAILRTANTDLDHVVSVTVYVTDIANWPEVNRVYAEVFGNSRPARVVAVSPQLHFGSLIEVQAVAIAGK